MQLAVATGSIRRMGVWQMTHASSIVLERHSWKQLWRESQSSWRNSRKLSCARPIRSWWTWECEANCPRAGPMIVSGEAGAGRQEERIVMFGLLPARVVRDDCWRMAMVLQADTPSVMEEEAVGGGVFRETMGSVF